MKKIYKQPNIYVREVKLKLSFLGVSDMKSYSGSGNGESSVAISMGDIGFGTDDADAASKQSEWDSWDDDL